MLVLLTFAIKVKAQLHADFTANSTQGCWPLVVEFTDVSKGNPTEWAWDLGNGITSNKKNASAFYITPGTYTIKLRIKNANGEDSITKTNFITVYDKPTVNFTASPTEGCVPLDVKFIDQSSPGSGTLTHWLWDFGNGVTSSEQNPQYTYTLVDTFNVTLEATNNFGCSNVLNKPLYIKLGGKVKAGFTYQYKSACAAPVLINFNNISQADKQLSYIWDFGDGASSTEENPKHNYAATGSFPVKLIAINEMGCADTIIETISVGISKTNFGFENSCVNAPVIFTDSSTPVPLSATWNFGDGTTGSGTVVKHAYNAKGDYNVTLNTDFGGCKGTIKKTISITDKPDADFDAAGDRYACKYPAAIQFKNKSKNAKNYKWISNGVTSTEENPTFTYSKPGKYSVTLIAITAGGCADTIIQNDYIQIGVPEIKGIKDLPIQGCAPQTIPFTPLLNAPASITSYFWDFGDGKTSTSAAPTHLYNAGVYDVKLIVTKASGCSDTLLIQHAVALANKPKADFTADPLDACASEPIQFKDASTGSRQEWYWTSGKIIFSTEQNPEFHYNDTGYINVALITGQYKCYDTMFKKDYLHIRPPTAKFAAISDCKKPFNYRFIDSSIGATGWNWEFGDGSTSNSVNPVHIYNKTGNYTVSLKTSNGSCSNKSYLETIHVIKENPTIRLVFPSSSRLCKHEYATYSITNYNPGNYLAYQWDFGDGIKSNFTSADSVVYHAYSKAGNYKTVLYLKNINNCIDSVTSNITVNGPVAAFSNIEGSCINSTITFKDSSIAESGTGILKWIWNYGDKTPVDTLNNIAFKHTYNNAGNFDVILRVIDNNGCYDTAIYKGLEITKPVVNFKAADTLNCSRDEVQFINSSQGASLTYNWNFGDGKASTEKSPWHQYATDGTYNVKLKITDKYNCVDSTSKSNYVTVATPVADFNLNDSVFACPPAKLVPINNTSKGYKKVLWDFGDGNSSEEINPLHYYTLTGLFTVKLIVYGYGSCTDTLSKSILVKGPSAAYTYSPLVGCDNVTATFKGTSKSVIKYTWDFGDGVTQTTKSLFVSHAYTSAGKYLPKLVVEDSNKCQIAIINRDSIIVSTAAAGFNIQRMQGVCDSSLFEFKDSSNVRFDVIDSYKWSFGDKDSASDARPEHFYNAEGIYNTSLSIKTKNGCQSSHTVPLNVLIDKTPKISAEIPDSTCINAPVSFTASAIGNAAETYTWSWNFDDDNSANTKNSSHTYNRAGKYNVSVAASTAAGCVATIKEPFVANPLPQTDAGINKIICREQPASLQASGADNYIWAAEESLSCTNCVNPFARPLTNKVYYVTGKNSFGCTTTDSVLIEVKQPTAVSLIAPDTICAGTTIKLAASGAELYQWKPGSLVSSGTDSVITSTPLQPVTYTVIGTDSEGCFSDTASVYVDVFPVPTIKLKDSVIDISVGSTIQLNAKPSPDVTNLMWSPAVNISCVNCPNPFISPRQSIKYVLNVSNPGRCTAQTFVTVNVSCNKEQNLYVPNAFSPNSDGMNDYFYPRGKGLFMIKSLRVFNRLGNMVFERSNFPANQQSYGWNGMYNGKPLPMDVYVYILETRCENGEVLSTKGNITLL